MLRQPVHAIVNAETACTCKLHWILCCLFSASYRLRIRTWVRQQKYSYFKDWAAMFLSTGGGWQEHLMQDSGLRWHSRACFLCPESVMSCHSSEQQVSISIVVNRTPVFCEIVVVKHSTNYRSISDTKCRLALRRYSWPLQNLPPPHSPVWVH
jgi:hypothetical protein